jgi:hypothetical protein
MGALGPNLRRTILGAHRFIMQKAPRRFAALQLNYAVSFFHPRIPLPSLGDLPDGCEIAACRIAKKSPHDRGRQPCGGRKVNL